MAYNLVISSPEGRVYSGSVEFFSLRGEAGDLAVLTGHTPFVTTVRPGKFKIEDENGETKTGTLESGILTVGPEETTLLTSEITFD